MTEQPERIGEVIESSTTEFTVHCYDLNGEPPLGHLIRVGQNIKTYAVVAHVSNTSLDQSRSPIALGRDVQEEEEIFRRNPQLPRLLRTQFQGLTLGYSQGSDVHLHLPSSPPRLHAFVYTAMADEIWHFTVKLDFLVLLLDVHSPAGDEILLAFLEHASRVHENPKKFLFNAGRVLAMLLSKDYLRLYILLKRLALASN